MTKVVLKWPVKVDDQWHPIGVGPVLMVDRQLSWSDEIQVWTVEEYGSGDTVPARVFGTGQEIADDVLMIGSVWADPYAWHVGVRYPEAPEEPAQEPAGRRYGPEEGCVVPADLLDRYEVSRCPCGHRALDHTWRGCEHSDGCMRSAVHVALEAALLTGMIEPGGEGR